MGHHGALYTKQLSSTTSTENCRLLPGLLSTLLSNAGHGYCECAWQSGSVSGAAMDDVTHIETIRQTAWNLYRAFRTYPEAEAAIRRAREQLFAPRPYFIDSEGNSARIIDALGYASFIASRYNLDIPALRHSGSLTDAGVYIIIQCIGWEILSGESLDEPPVPLTPEQLAESPFLNRNRIPISFGYYSEESRVADGMEPWILIHPLMYPTLEAFRTAMEQELPKLYSLIAGRSKSDGEDFYRAQERVDERLSRVGRNHLTVPPEEYDVLFTRSRSRRGAIGLSTLSREASWWAAYRADRITMYEIAGRENAEPTDDGPPTVTRETTDIRRAIIRLERRHGLKRRRHHGAPAGE
jgi:hypothetical protein